jgi:hypothetical protein
VVINVKLKSDIRKKLRIFNELDLPLLVKSGFISVTANCNNDTTNCNVNYAVNSSNNAIQSQIMVAGRDLICLQCESVVNLEIPLA